MTRITLGTVFTAIWFATPLPSQQSGQVVVRGPLAARADSTMQALVPRGFSGVVLVAKDGQVVLQQGYGLADRAANRPMTGSSVVQIGSNTKDFTAVAILQLMESGKLSLDDSIARFFPGVPVDKAPITVRMLLNHQAGFEQHLGPDDQVISRDEEIREALKAPLAFPAGSSRKYSNIGYSLLAAIIEKLSGTSYDQYVADHILKPLGMKATGLLLPHFDPTRLARGYRDGEPQPTFLERPHAPDGVWWNLRGNGGMLSTVSDMLTFYRALMSDGPLLKPASRNIMFHPDEPQVLAGSDLTYYFFYTRAPRAGLELFLATNSNAFPAPQARGLLDQAFGLQGPGGPGGRGGGAPGALANAPAVGLPDTPAGRGVKRYLEVFAHNDADTMRAFLRDEVVQAADDHRTLEERVARMQSMRSDLGGLVPVQIVSASEQEITVKARSPQQGEVTMVFTVEAKAPWRIVQIRIAIG